LVTKRIKDKEHKKKKLKSSSTAVVTSAVLSVVSPAAEHENVVASHLSLAVAGAAVPLPGAAAEETEVTQGVSEGNIISSHTGIALGSAGAVPATTSGPKDDVLQIASLTCTKKLQKPKDLPKGENLGIWLLLWIFTKIFYTPVFNSV
jgi:hypothetical protein